MAALTTHASPRYVPANMVIHHVNRIDDFRGIFSVALKVIYFLNFLESFCVAFLCFIPLLGHVTIVTDIRPSLWLT